MVLFEEFLPERPFILIKPKRQIIESVAENQFEILEIMLINKNSYSGDFELFFYQISYGRI